MTSEIKEATKWWVWAVAMIILTSVSIGVFNFVTKPAQVLDRVTNPDHIITSYEDFQEMYNTTQSICTKISNLKELNSETSGFSKEERILAEQNNLSRWVEEYNAKSKMMTRNYWKSGSLPSTLNFNTVCD